MTNAIKKSEMNTLSQEKSGAFQFIIALAMNVVMLVVLLPDIFLHGSESVYFPGINGTDGVYGDSSLGVWWVWMLSRLGIGSSVNSLNSYPWGEVGWGTSSWSQIFFIGPAVLLAKIVRPVLAWNIVTSGYILSGGMSIWWAAKRVSGSWKIALFVVPFGAYFEFLIWSIGGPSALLAYWPLPILLVLLAQAKTKWNRTIGLVATLLTIVCLLTDPFIALAATIIWFASLLTYLFNREGGVIKKTSTSFLIAYLGLLPFLLTAINKTASSSSSGFARSFQEWEAFGASWWMVLIPSPNIPFLGNFFESLRNWSTGDVRPVVELSGQLSQPGIVISAAMFLGFSIRIRNRFRLGTSSSDIPYQILLTTWITSILLSIVVPSNSFLHNFAPSTLLYQFSSIWRYTGRLTVLTHIVGSILLAYELSKFYIRVDARLNLRRVAVTALCVSLVILEILLPVLSVPYRSFSYDYIPNVYKDLSNYEFAPYVDIPTFSPDAPYPSSVFQVLSNQPSLDRVSTSLIGNPITAGRYSPDLLALTFESMCSKQVPASFIYMGFKYAVVHVERFATTEEQLALNLSNCGWKIVKKYRETKQISKRLFPLDQTLWLVEPFSKVEVAAVMIPDGHQWSGNFNLSLDHSHTLRTLVGDINLVRNPTREPEALKVSFQSNSKVQVQVLCPGSNSTPKLEAQKSLLLGKVEVDVGKNCTGLRVTKREDRETTLSDFIALPSPPSGMFEIK